MKRTAIIVASVVWILGAIAAAQESRSEISLQGIGFFTSNTNNANINRNVNDTGGLLLGYRYHLNRWLAAEGNYGFARDTQDFTTPNGAFGGKVDIHQMTGDLVFKLPAVARLKMSPYALAGGGALMFYPSSSEFNTNPLVGNQTRGAFLYGAGANFPMTKHLSLRAEYRGFLYNTPHYGLGILQPATLTHTAQPSLGIAYRF